MNLVHLVTRNPLVGPSAQRSYHLLRYLTHLTPGFRMEVPRKCRVLTPAQWACVSASRGTEFFGYYDKTPWSADGQRLLLHRHKRGREVDVVVYGRQSRSVRRAGTTGTWNWQQGAMAQWMPAGGEYEFVHNTLAEGELSALLYLKPDRTRRLPWPVQALHPLGSEYLSLNYTRLAIDRPDYGYRVSSTNFHPDQAIDGIWRIRIELGAAELLVSLEDLAHSDPPHGGVCARHWVNHCLYSPSGDSFVFLHRWRVPPARCFRSRLYVYRCPAESLHLLLDEDLLSHYWWLDEDTLMVWASRDGHPPQYRLVDVGTGAVTEYPSPDLSAHGDGHPSVTPDRRWLVTDSYPDIRSQQRLMLQRLSDGSVHVVGRFLHSPRHSGAARCDLHPRWNHDGTCVSFDSVFSGTRRSYILDLSEWMRDSAASPDA